MASYGGYYKGEKKKHKKAKKDNKNVFSNAPTYEMPEIITKKNKNEQ